MKKIKKDKIIILAIILVALILVLFLTREQKEDISTTNIDTDNGISEDFSNNQTKDSNQCLDMQGYEFCTPGGFECDGGFKHGYRYFDVVCNIEGRDDFEVVIDFGLASTAYTNSISETMIGVRSFEFTGGQYGVSVCSLHQSENLNLGAEHWLCKYPKDDNMVITLGIGKSFLINDVAVGRWFESHLLISEYSDGINDEDYIKIMETLVNDGVKIDWSFFDPAKN